MTDRLLDPLADPALVRQNVQRALATAGMPTLLEAAKARLRQPVERAKGLASVAGDIGREGFFPWYNRQPALDPNDIADAALNFTGAGIMGSLEGKAAGATLPKLRSWATSPKLGMSQWAQNKLASGDYKLIEIPIEKFNEQLGPHMRLDLAHPKGGANSIGDRLPNARARFEAGQPPNLGYADEGVTIGDGRHRLAAAYQLGDRTAPALVPAEHAAEIEAALAPAPAAVETPIASSTEEGTGALGASGKRMGSRPRGIIDRQRVGWPGIYDDPRTIAERAARQVAPEDPAMRRLFGVTRDDLYGLSQQGARPGNAEPNLVVPAKPGGSAAAERIMTPANKQRILDVLGEAGKHPGLMKGMDAWYVMDPAYWQLEHLLGADRAKIAYSRLNAFTGMASPGSEVLTEINRGTAANWLSTQGRFGDFEKYGGMAAGTRGADFPADMRAITPHPYHSTSQALPMRAFDATGQVRMQSPKVPLYIQASGVPQTGFQTKLPVGDAHWVRGIGLGDARTSGTPGESVSTPELLTLAPWWKKIADQLGIEPVPAQARAWGAFSPQTGVTSPIGAPKLELFSRRIMEAAKRLGITPEQARDLVLTGGGHAQLAPLDAGPGQPSGLLGVA